MCCAPDWIAPRCLVRSPLRIDGAVFRSRSSCFGEIHTDPISVLQVVQCLLGEPLSFTAGGLMHDNMAKGRGFGENSRFLIRHLPYREIGGHEPRLPYAGDYDLPDCRRPIPGYSHTDESLFCGRKHPRAKVPSECQRVLKTDAGMRIVVPSLENAIAAHSVRKMQWFSDWPSSDRSSMGRFSAFIFCHGQDLDAFDFDYMSEMLWGGLSEVEKNHGCKSDLSGSSARPVGKRPRWTALVPARGSLLLTRSGV
jgi:hypothetical protein